MRPQFRRVWRKFLGGVLPLVCLAVLLASPPTAAGEAEVQVDAGWLIPGGDLADDFLATRWGFGADAGLELGFHWRYRFNEDWSIAPAFRFADLGDFNGDVDTPQEYRIQSSSYRYTLEVRRTFRSGFPGLEPFLAMGGGVFRNRYLGWDKEILTAVDQSQSTLGLFAHAGFRFKEVELGVVYNRNRFASWRFFTGDREREFDWDTVCVRMSWVIPGT
ncbi:MAG: outer membrane beta-barrel protein [Candidatus Krumholzibacteriia bacterium]